MANQLEDMKCRGCCGYPNGKLGIAAICVAIVGLIMANVASFGCRYFTIRGLLYFGYFSYHDEATGVCINWADSSIDPPSWKFASAMAILATVCGIAALSFTFSLSCVSMPNIFLKIMSITYLVAGFCIILTFVGFAGCEFLFGEQCSLAGTGFLAIIAPIIYFVAAAIIFKIPAYESDGTPVTTKGVESSNQEVTIEVTELADGSKKTVKTVVDKYGNKTIEETLESPVEEEEEGIEREYLPDGSILARRTTYDEDGNKVIRETIEKAPQA